MVFHRYVALGDSFTEGVGDADPTRPNGVRGWADRVAEVLTEQTDDFGYANLAIRGRKVQQVIDEQIDPAIAMAPDLVTIYAGGNDVLRPKVDIDALAAAYDEAIARLVDTGALVGVFTAFDPGAGGLFGPLRGRFAIYNELIREIVDVRGAMILDSWRMHPDDPEHIWAEDRLHLGPVGHQHVAIAVLDRLGVPHRLEPLEPEAKPELSKAQARAANREWARTHAVPWVHRRLTGRSSGDSLEPKRPGLSPVR